MKLKSVSTLINRSIVKKLRGHKQSMLSIFLDFVYKNKIVIPSKAAPPAMKPSQEPVPKREKDELENLINQIE